MLKLFWFIGATVGGVVGWWLGGMVNVWAAVVLGTVGTALGVYWARRYVSDNF